MSLIKKLAIGGVLLGLGITLYTRFPKNEITTIIKDEFAQIKPHVRTILPITSQNADRTFYYILQTHGNRETDDLIREQAPKAWQETVTSQIAVYNIINYLASTKKIAIATFEGTYFGDTFYGTTHMNCINALKPPYNPLFVNALLNKDPHGTEILVQCANPKLFVSGWEDRESNERAGRNIDQAFDDLQSGKTETKELLERKDGLGTLERTKQSIIRTYELSDLLYAKGIIQSRDSAIVIGRGHIKDLQYSFSDLVYSSKPITFINIKIIKISC